MLASEGEEMINCGSSSRLSDGAASKTTWYAFVMRVFVNPLVIAYPAVTVLQQAVVTLRI